MNQSFSIVSSRYPRIFPICRKADIADEQTFFTWDFIVKCSSKMQPKFLASLDGMIGVLPIATDIVTSSRAREMNLDGQMNHFCLVIIKDQLIVSSPCSNVPNARVKPVSRDLLTDRVMTDRV